MTREEAIKMFQELKKDMYDIAVEALKTQDATDTNVGSNGDTIYRQAAIDALSTPYGILYPIRAVEELPSAQPEKVKCKKCRYVYYDKEFGNYWCNRKPDSFMVEEDGYCKWGK